MLAFICKLYKILISPFMQCGCRYLPTCSEYAEEAFVKHGAIKGCFLTIKRIIRCNPFGGSGFDPVPSNLVSNTLPSDMGT